MIQTFNYTAWAPGTTVKTYPNSPATKPPVTFGLDPSDAYYTSVTMASTYQAQSQVDGVVYTYQGNGAWNPLIVGIVPSSCNAPAGYVCTMSGGSTTYTRLTLTADGAPVPLATPAPTPTPERTPPPCIRQPCPQ